MSKNNYDDSTAIIEKDGEVELSMGDLKKYLDKICNYDLSEAEQEQFIMQCKINKLNPYKKEIYPVPFGKGKHRKIEPVVRYTQYIMRAEKSERLDGWEVKVKGNGRSMRAFVRIWRRDWSEPFTHSVKLSEYNKHNMIWKNKPETMLKKVAISQGFRLAFPGDLEGLPYSAEELNEVIDVTPDEEEEKEILDIPEKKGKKKGKKKSKKKKSKKKGKKKKTEKRKLMEKLKKNGYEDKAIDIIKEYFGKARITQNQARVFINLVKEIENNSETSTEDFLDELVEESKEKALHKIQDVITSEEESDEEDTDEEKLKEKDLVDEDENNNK